MADHINGDVDDVLVAPAAVAGFTAALMASSAWLLLFAVLGLVLTLDPDQSDRRPAGYALVSRSARAAAVLTWTYVAAFGSPSIPNAAYLLQNGTVRWFFDIFAVYGGPLLARLSNGALAGAIVAFLLVTLVAAWAAWLVWNGSKIGAILGLALLPLDTVFWIGFALPLPWIIGVARVMLLALAWRSLNWPPGRSLAGTSRSTRERDPTRPSPASVWQ